MAEPRRRRGSAARSQFPWTGDEIAKLADAVRDGIPPKSVALMLGRSHNSVLAQLKLMGVKINRVGANTHAVALRLRHEAADVLAVEASARHMTLNSFCRYLLELAAREHAWLDRLIDDDAVASRHDALSLAADPRPAPPPPVVIAPEPEQAASPVPAQLFTVLSPLLEGRI
jgi:hypothetical protein